MLTWVANSYYFVLALSESVWQGTRTLLRTWMRAHGG